MAVTNFKESSAYKKAFALAMHIFEVSKSFPKEETYSLTDQVRRSSRSVCANLAEAFRRKRYPANFISKLTDCDAENAETQTWLDFALACRYIPQQVHHELELESLEVGRLLHHILTYPEKY